MVFQVQSICLLLHNEHRDKCMEEGEVPALPMSWIVPPQNPYCKS